MGALFIIGNGFDLAHGMPTKYSDFRNFLVKIYPDAEKYKDYAVSIEDYMYMDDERKFAAEILLSTMDKVAGNNWCDFEESLARIDFGNKFPGIAHSESGNDEEHKFLIEQYLSYMDRLSGPFIHCSKYWQEFFELWMQDIKSQIDSNKFQPRENLKELFSQPDTQFFTFNYTRTLRKLYNKKPVIHIHNRVGKRLLFGHGEEDATTIASCDNIYFGSSFIDDMTNTFKKDTETALKNNKQFFDALDHKIDKVYSYGFGYGKVDGVYISKIVKSISPNAKWFFTTFEAKDSEALRIKKVKLRNYGFKGSFSLYEG